MGASILLSVHPQFVEKILTGEKRFEFRTHLPQKSVSRIFIYATSPLQKCVAVAEIEKTLQGTPACIWQKTRYASGIPRTQFMEYFKGRSVAYAYKLGRVHRVTQTDDVVPGPQSFSYLSDEQLKFYSIEKDTCFSDNMVFVAGMHGIGKSTLAANYIAPLGFECVSASSIIKEQKGNVSEDKKNKEINDNQKLLVNGIAKYKVLYNQLAIDGHFVLLNENMEFTEIDEDVFKAISPSAIILLTTNSPSIIRDRLVKRGMQDTWSIPFIRDFLRREKTLAIRVAKSLCIPLIVYDIKDKPGIIVRSLRSLICKTTKF
jgi:predicted transcriptional regulator/adenylate kinase